MPSGTGKTVSLLSLIVSYQQVHSLPPFIRCRYSPISFQVPPHSPEADILFAYSTWNRESIGWVEKTDGIQNIVCRHIRGERKRIELHRTGIDEPKESLYTSWGVWMNAIGINLCSFYCILSFRFQKRKKAKSWMRDAVISRMPPFAKREDKIQTLWTCVIGMRYTSALR